MKYFLKELVLCSATESLSFSLGQGHAAPER
jgi:hypothetical protein